MARRLRVWRWWRGWHTRSPWVDPRAWVGSGAVHAAGFTLLAVATSYSAQRPGAVEAYADGPVYAELEPVDTRKAVVEAEAPAVDRPEPASGAASPAAAQGEAAGGPGGSAAGPGGDHRLGSGGTLFRGEEVAHSYVYVIDHSGSMWQYGWLRLAKQELKASLARLPESSRVAVLFYNTQTMALTRGLEPVTAELRERLERALEAIAADGGTRPRPALEAALLLEPEVVYFLTDGQELTLEDVERLRDLAHGTRIHCVEIGGRDLLPSRGERPLERLARISGGVYRHLDAVPQN